MKVNIRVPSEENTCTNKQGKGSTEIKLVLKGTVTRQTKHCMLLGYQTEGLMCVNVANIDKRLYDAHTRTQTLSKQNNNNKSDPLG